MTSRMRDSSGLVGCSFQRLHDHDEGFIEASGYSEVLPTLHQSSLERIDFRAPPAFEVLQHRRAIGSLPAMGMDQHPGIVFR